MTSAATIQPAVSMSVSTNLDQQAIYSQMAARIIEQQEAIIGPMAIDRAKLVAELTIDWAKHAVTITGDPQAALNGLIGQYKELFGQIAVETCREAVAKLVHQLPAHQLPTLLQ